MRIGIDCRIMKEGPTGMKRFGSNLLKNLARMDHKNTYLIFLDSSSKEYFLDASANLELKPLKLQLFSISEQIGLPLLLRKERLDIFHSLSFGMPVFSSIPSVMTIYDLIHLLFPQNYPKKLSLYYKVIVKRAAGKVRRILTISQTSKRDIVRLLGVCPEKVCVIYPAVDERFEPMETGKLREELESKYGIRKKFLLYVGNMRPHKNLVSLIEAFQQVRKVVGDIVLVICGKRQYSFPQIQSKVRHLNLKDEVLFIENVSDAVLILLYNAAQVVVLPSLYEGFGLPPLEAMACGTPVAVSNIGALRETLADAALFFDPYNVQSMSETLVDILTDESLRSKLITSGFGRAELYSWEKSALSLITLYEGVYNS